MSIKIQDGSVDGVNGVIVDLTTHNPTNPAGPKFSPDTNKDGVPIKFVSPSANLRVQLSIVAIAIRDYSPFPIYPAQG